MRTYRIQNACIVALALLAALGGPSNAGEPNPPPPNPDNRPPSAADDDAFTFVGQPVAIPVLANDQDPDGDPLVIGGVTQAAHGIVSSNCAGGTAVYYVPEPGFTGHDSFTYSVSDGRIGGAASASVAITVYPAAAPYTWGSGSNGALGNGATRAECWPVLVHELTNVVAVTGGGSHSLALSGDRTVWAWGKGSSGELGNGTSTDSHLPVQVCVLAEAVGIAAGESHSLAVRADGKVWAWGSNRYGELGDGSTNQSRLPVEISGITNAIAVACGSSHSLALKSDGTVWAWGYNYYGRLGNGTNLDSAIPVQVADLTKVVAVAADSANSLALRSDGTVWAWGSGRYGALGNGSTSQHSRPVQVLGLSNVVGIGQGGGHGLARRANGTVWAWGRGDYGQLGDDSVTNSSIAVEVMHLTNVVAVAAGQSHSLALGADGTAWAWGSGSSGVLGNNTFEDSSLPVQVSEPGPWIAIGSQSTHSLAIRLNVPWISALQPEIEVEFGRTAILSVVARGVSPLFYQWQRGGVDLANGDRISGATRPDLWIGEAQYPDAGQYAVVVCNQYGYATGHVAALTISKPTPPASWTVPPGISYGTPLTAAQLNATASVPGAFIYTPSLGTMLKAGTHALTACFTPADTNTYRAIYLTNALTVTKVPLTIAADSFTRPYHAPNPELTIDYLGFVNGEGEAVLSQRPTVTTPATVDSPVGVYAVTVSGGLALNYEFSYTNGALTIVPATPVVAWTNLMSITYGAPVDLTLLKATADVSGNFEILSAGTNTFSAGTHTLTLRFLPNDARDYSQVTGTVQLVVSPARLTIKAEDKTRIYHQMNPALTVTYGGFVNGDTERDLSQPVRLETGATLTSPVGLYAIEAKNAAAANYEIEYETGILTITPATPELAWNVPADITYGTPLSTNQLNASASVPGSFEYVPPGGTWLEPGTHLLTVLFFPADNLNYTRATGSVQLVILPQPNRPPVAVDDVAVTFTGQAVDIATLANDTDQDSDVLVMVTAADGKHGTVIRRDDSLTYLPATAYVGADSFEYTISDNRGGTATARVAVQVLPAPTVRAFGQVSGADVPARFTISLPTLPSRRYLLESSDSLVSPQWQPVQELLGDGTELSIPLDAAVGAQRFYRIGVLPETKMTRP